MYISYSIYYILLQYFIIGGGSQIAVPARATGRSRRMAKRIPKVRQRGGAPSHVSNLTPSSVYHTQDLSLMLRQIALDT